jgi:penicillin amidase
MAKSLTAADLQAAVPELTGTLRLPGIEHPVEIYRDTLGIPHIKALGVGDAFFAQGFVHAQDRLWQMDSDRHRAYGRWAEYVGPQGVAHDRLLRRFRLEASAREDFAAVNPQTRALLEAYAAGVTAFLQTTPRLPVEYQLLDVAPEPWQPWDACAVFKVRHLFTGGVVLGKLWRARLLHQLGPELTAVLCEGSERDQPLIIPPGAGYPGTPLHGLAEFQQGAEAVGLLRDLVGGSNSWAVAGQRTASGSPLLAGDPHRALEVPNVYHQNHVACPAFDAIGLSFPGFPGFPHFGHNRHVAWCVTTTMADSHDLFIERFHPEHPERYLYQGQWREATRSREVIRVRGGEAVTHEVTATQHGPIVVGDPAQGTALALRSVATAFPNAGFDALLPMLQATTAGELEAAMQPWADPGNNLVFADVHGSIGYRLRGQIPLRARANAWLPVPGWTGAHEWQGTIPFAEMPHLHNPEEGVIVTANNRVVGDEYPHHIALYYEAGFRARRIHQRLAPLTRATVADMRGIHADRVSLPGRAFVRLLAAITPQDGPSAQAQAYLQDWDGTMACESVAATLYAVCREETLQLLLPPLLGPLAREASRGGLGGGVAFLGRLRARLVDLIEADDRRLLPAGTDWPTLLGQALARAVGWLERTLGEEMGAWQWGRLHRLAPQHPLAASFPEAAPALNPPALPLGGDADTVQATAYPVGVGYTVSSTSVARYVFDLADWERSRWVVPLGVSGHPGSPHYTDQLSAWATGELLPMLYDWTHIRNGAEAMQRLEPAAYPG